jgi:hypothetical protein
MGGEAHRLDLDAGEPRGADVLPNQSKKRISGGKRSASRA